jgi:hypothetical protein
MLHYSATKKNEIMLFAGKWIVREITVLNKISQTQKDKCHMLLSYVESRFFFKDIKVDRELLGVKGHQWKEGG